MANVLVGKRIKEIYLANDNQAIKFVLNNEKEIVARADDDCCSYTWIENIDGIEQILNSPIVSVEDIELPERESIKHPDSDVVAYYGLKIISEKGFATIDYRNDSNGYYGGDLSWPGDNRYYGGVHGQNVSTEIWNKVS